MPTYEYECTSCGHRFEVFQSMTEERLKDCPKCHKKLRRLVGSGAGIIFRGAGFYATDYRKKAPGDSSKKEPPDKKESSSPPDKKEG